MRGLVAAGLIVLSSGAAPAAAAEPKPLAVHALQCFIVTAELSQSSDEKLRRAGTMAMTFYMGQLFGADPAVDVEKGLIAEAKAMTPERAKALGRECGAEMQRRGAQVEAAGRAVSDNEKKHPQ
jgi:hypothetical protein